MKVRKYTTLGEKIEIFERFSKTGEKLTISAVFEGYPVGMWAIQIRSLINYQNRTKDVRVINPTEEQLQILQNLGILDKRIKSTVNEKIDMLVDWMAKYPNAEVGKKIPEDILRKYATTDEEYARFLEEYKEVQQCYDYVRRRKSNKKLTRGQISRCKEGNVRGVFGYPTQVVKLAKKTGKSEKHIEYIIINYGTMANFINLYREGELPERDAILASSMLRNVIDIDLNPDSDKFDKLYCDIVKKTQNDNILEIYSSDEIRRNIASLSQSQKDVIKKRYGLLDGSARTLADISKEMEISNEGVRKIEEGALYKIRMQLAFAKRKFKKGIYDCMLDLMTDEEREMIEGLKDKLYGSDIIFRSSSYDMLQQDDKNEEILRAFSFIKNMEQILEERTNQIPDSNDDSSDKRLKSKPILDLSVEEMGLGKRISNSLRRARINTLGDIIQYSERDLRRIKTFGEVALTKLINKIAEYGLTLKESKELLQEEPKNEEEAEKRKEEPTNGETNGNEFIADVVSYARKRKDLKTQEEKAAELEKQYEAQASENENLLDDGSK